MDCGKRKHKELPFSVPEMRKAIFDNWDTYQNKYKKVEIWRMNRSDLCSFFTTKNASEAKTPNQLLKKRKRTVVVKEVSKKAKTAEAPKKKLKASETPKEKPKTSEDPKQKIKASEAPKKKAVHVIPRPFKISEPQPVTKRANTKPQTDNPLSGQSKRKTLRSVIKKVRFADKPRAFDPETIPYNFAAFEMLESKWSDLKMLSHGGYTFFIVPDTEPEFYKTRYFGKVNLQNTQNKNELLYFASCVSDGSLDPECSYDFLFELPRSEQFEQLKQKYKGLGVQKREAMKKEAISVLANEFKIHLMPKKAQAVSVFDKVLELVDESKLETFTVKIRLDYDSFSSNPEQIMPIIVIYVYGADRATKALAVLKKEFEGLEGIDKTPRFNEKVNSLLYWAGGDGSLTVGGNL